VRNSCTILLTSGAPRVPRKPCASIYELAERTGVSPSTVSRVLNGRGRIAPATREKVLAAARAARFRPRAASRPTTVAVVIDRTSSLAAGGFVSALLTHVLDGLAQARLAAQVFTEKSVAGLRDRLVDGVLAMTWDAETVAQLRRLKGVPVVLLNRMDVPEFSAVATDHRAAGRAVGEYLLARGHRRVAFLAEEPDWGARERLDGLRSALDAAGSALPEPLAAFSQHQPLYGLLPRLMESEPSAMFLAGEDIALEASYILTEVLGARIPADVSVVGLENRRVSSFLRPPHTTLAQPLDRLAAEAMSVLLEHIDTGEPAPVHRTIENELIERESVRTIPQRRTRRPRRRKS